VVPRRLECHSTVAMLTLALWLDMSHLHADNTAEKVDFASVAVVVVVVADIVAAAVGTSPTAALLFFVS
jgi:hypothetical protein